MAKKSEIQLVMEKVESRFKSGNMVPVERAHVTASEWEVIRQPLWQLVIVPNVERQETKGAE